MVYEGIERGWMNLIIQFEYQKHLSINILKGIRAWVRRKSESWSGESRRSSFLFFATFVIPRIARQKMGYVLGDGARLSQVSAYIPCHTYFMNKRSPQRRHKPRERESEGQGGRGREGHHVTQFRRVRATRKRGRSESSEFSILCIGCVLPACTPLANAAVTF